MPIGCWHKSSPALFAKPWFHYDTTGQTETVSGASTNTSYIFDAAHRVVGYNSNSHTASYQYDGSGNRLKATRNGITTQYIYDAAGNLLAEANASGTITRYYIHGLGLMAMVDAQSNQLYVYHFDGTGHTIAITSSTQAIVNRYAYAPYGKLLAKQEQISQPFTYVGQYGVMIEANNVYYMRARYYDAEVGRFISEDPIGFAGGINLYAYVGGNPVVLVDPSGLSAATMWIVARGNIGIAIFNLNPGVDSDLESDLINHYFRGNGASFTITSEQWQQVQAGIKSGDNSYYDQGLGGFSGSAGKVESWRFRIISAIGK